MKNLFKYIFVAAALVITSAAASAQSQYTDAEKAAIKVSKSVEGPAKDGSFTLTLDTFVAGDFVLEETSASLASDIVLVLDMSGSMLNAMDKTDDVYFKTEDSFDTIVSNVANTTYDSKHYYLRYDDDDYMLITSATKSGGNYSVSSRYNTDQTLSKNGKYVRAHYGDIYEGGPSRLEVLKSSTKQFVNIIEGYTSDKVKNRISIVTFAGSSATSVITNQLVDASGAQTLREKIDGLSAYGGTPTLNGLNNAKSILDNITYNTQKSVILFTDGETGSDKGDVVKTTNAIKSGADAKNKNDATDKGIATIYTIGAFEEVTAGSSIDNFLNYNSSNYTSVSYTAATRTRPESYSGTDATKKDYYFIASNSSQLQAAFEKAAGGVVPKGGEGINVSKDKITIKDIVTSKFVLPNGASDVTVKMVPVKVVPVSATATAASYVPQWGSSVDAEGVAVDVVDSGLTDEGGNALKSIDVKGFDFSTHWVGLDRTVKDGKQTAAAVHADGAKLQIKIKIVPDPNDVGGEVKTNDDRSGFYFDDETAPLQNYTTPGAVFVPMDMDIILNGLDADESALFNVYRYKKDVDGKDTKEKEYIMTVALTGKSSATTVSKLPIVDYIVDKDDPDLIHQAAITYFVECDSNWSWKYDITPSATEIEDAEHPLFYRTGGGVFTSTNKYVFNAVKTEKGRLPVNKDDKGGTAKYVYDESNENNVFKRVTK